VFRTSSAPPKMMRRRRSWSSMFTALRAASWRASNRSSSVRCTSTKPKSVWLLRFWSMEVVLAMVRQGGGVHLKRGYALRTESSGASGDCRLYTGDGRLKKQDVY
jgi:hypothetical protein